MDTVKIPGEIQAAFPNIPLGSFKMERTGAGLIHATFILKNEETNHSAYVLQQINTIVFPNIDLIEENYKTAYAFIRSNYPAYPFLQIIQNRHGNYSFRDSAGNLWRLMRFVQDAVCFHQITSPAMAFEAAHAFASLSRLLTLSGATNYQSPLPNFHHLGLRFKEFEMACVCACTERRRKASAAIDLAYKHKQLVKQFWWIYTSQQMPLRVIHADTKISNLLFHSKNNSVLCVIDLDTLMPGYFISDLGDMIRTSVFDAPEDEPHPENCKIQYEFFQSLIQGYLSGLNHGLNKVEKENIFYSGCFMLYMQALRFLTDYLQNDRYYTIQHEEHNLQRANCQLHQLQLYLKEEYQLQQFIKEAIVPV